MAILITGATGFVGSHLAKKLIEEFNDVRVYALVRGNSQPAWRWRILGLEGKIRVVEGDLTDPTSIEKAVNKVKPSVVFHLGAQSFVGRSFKAPLETFNTNATGTVALLEAVKKYKSHVIVAGSSEEYGVQIISMKEYEAFGEPYPEPERIPEIPITEDNPLRPVSPYALSKIAEEEACKTYNRMYGIPCVTLRVFNTEGPLRGHQFVTSEIVRQMIMVKKGAREYIELGNLGAMRDWSHIEDTVNAYITAMEKNLVKGVYNVASDRMNSVAYFVARTFEIVFDDEIEEITYKDLKVNSAKELDPKILYSWVKGEEPFEPNTNMVIKSRKRTIEVHLVEQRFRPADVPHLWGNPSRFYLATGWRHTHSLDDIIEDMVKFYGGQH